MLQEKKINAFDVIACVLNSVAFFVNFWVFFPILKEQIETGWGFSTRFEMLVLLFWMVQIMTVPLLLVGLVNIIYTLIKDNTHSLFVANAVILGATVLCIVLSVVFEFY